MRKLNPDKVLVTEKDLDHQHTFHLEDKEIERIEMNPETPAFFQFELKNKYALLKNNKVSNIMCFDGTPVLLSKNKGIIYFMRERKYYESTELATLYAKRDSQSYF